jgi:hypothetical protein
VSTRTRGRPGRWTVAKDAVLFTLGVGLILYEALLVPPHDFNLWVLGLGATLTGVPGFGQLIAMRTGGSLSLPPEPESPPPSSPSSSTSGAEK